jgi:hypothetical protein
VLVTERNAKRCVILGPVNQETDLQHGFLKTIYFLNPLPMCHGFSLRNFIQIVEFVTDFFFLFFYLSCHLSCHGVAHRHSQISDLPKSNKNAHSLKLNESLIDFLNPVPKPELRRFNNKSRIILTRFNQNRLKYFGNVRNYVTRILAILTPPSPFPFS